MEDQEMEEGSMSPAAGALGLLRKKRSNLGMMDPASTNKEGTEFMIDKSMTPDNLKPGQEVTVKARVTKVGSQISMAPVSVELEGEAEEEVEAPEEKPYMAAKPGAMDGRLESPTGSITIK